MFVAITGIPDFQLSVNVCENVSGHVDKIAINEGLISAITLLKSPLLYPVSYTHLTLPTN